MMTPNKHTRIFVFYIYLTIIGSVISCSAFAQANVDSVLLTIGGEKVTVSEVMSLYRKNYIKGSVIDKKAFDEYLELFINYKLKIRQAHDLKIGYDFNV